MLEAVNVVENVMGRRPVVNHETVVAHCVKPHAVKRHQKVTIWRQ